MNLFRAFKTVFWLFFGVRSDHGRVDDFKEVNGKKIITMGVAIFIAFIGFIAGIYLFAKMATS